MKQFIIVLLVSLLIPIACISQTIYPQKVNDSLILITAKQLKQSNLIFAEHNTLLIQNDLLSKRVSTLKQLNNNWKTTDSIKTVNYNDSIKTMNKKFKVYKTKRTFKEIIVGILVVAGIILY